MKAETDDGCSCPRCYDHIPEEFYCRNCGYVPDWRQRAYEEHGASREAARRQRAAFRMKYNSLRRVGNARRDFG
jgi:hypothetical protein